MALADVIEGLTADIGAKLEKITSEIQASNRKLTDEVWLTCWMAGIAAGFAGVGPQERSPCSFICSSHKRSPRPRGQARNTQEPRLIRSLGRGSFAWPLPWQSTPRNQTRTASPSK